MTWVLVAAVIALLLMCIFLAEALHRMNKKYWDVVQNSSRLIADLHAKSQVQNYLALEKGMDEQQESYEQEYLTWQEKEFGYMWELAHVMNALYDAEWGVDQYS